MKTHSVWYSEVPENFKNYIESQPKWYDRDLYRMMAAGVGIGSVIGIFVGFNFARYLFL
jgi:hypothetical protein